MKGYLLSFCLLCLFLYEHFIFNYVYRNRRVYCHGLIGSFFAAYKSSFE